MKADITFTNCGSIMLVTPATEAGRGWLEENVETEGWQWMGPSLGVEPRFAFALAEGMAGDGLSIA